MLAELCVCLAFGGGDVVGAVPRGTALMAAAQRRLMPAPNKARYVYELDPSMVLPSGERPAAYAFTDTNTVYLRSRARDPLSRFSRAHETGHLFDSQVLSDGDRRYFQRILHAPGQWGAAAPGAIDPAEIFADYYGAAASGINASNGYSAPTGYAVIGEKRMERFVAALDRLGRRHGLRAYRPPR